MVYYFTSTIADPPATIYVGKDKNENEELIKYGWEEDVWYHCWECPALFSHGTNLLVRFHVDNLSSAHIYLRLTTGQSWEDIPKELVDDCAQLTKANSIEGNKRDNVTVIYTPWSNLKKDGSMAVGQVSFHDPKKTKRILLTTRLNPVVNRLTKTRTEIPPPASSAYLLEARDSHLATKRKAANAILQERKKEEARLAKERREEKLRREREWEELYGPEAVQRARMKNGGTEIEDVWEGEGGEVSNHDGFDEDDFM